MTEDNRTRLNYHNGLFLTEEEFKTEQKFHIAQQQFHNQYLHIPGIAKGLDVTVNNTDKSIVKISEGAAVDEEGNILVLKDDDKNREFRIDPEKYESGKYYLVIYKNEESVTTVEEQNNNNKQKKYIVHKTIVELVSDITYNSNSEIYKNKIKIPLAILNIEVTNGKIEKNNPDTSVRTEAGAKVGAGAINSEGGGIIKGTDSSKKTSLDIFSNTPSEDYTQGYFNASSFIFKPTNDKRTEVKDDETMKNLRNAPSGLIVKVTEERDIDGLGKDIKPHNAALVALSRRDVGGIYVYAQERKEDNLPNSLTPSHPALFVHGSIVTGGGAKCLRGEVWENASSIEYKEDVKALNLEDAIEVLAKLHPVTFKYKTELGNRNRVGFIAEDMPDMISSTDRKTVSPLDIIGILTKVVQQQQEEIDNLKEKLKKL
ncbi:MAG: hypothetical protein N5P05_004262 (plasmid) [Chroococcopsis gigantea SAG 12.99]|jgi:hypothetical protein|nr:hypothetical protein [Chroococcopsis gigantea SAG 12.99]